MVIETKTVFYQSNGFRGCSKKCFKKGIHTAPIEGSGTYYFHHNDIIMNDGNPLSNPFLVNSFGIGITGMNLLSSVLIEENTIDMQDCDLGIFTLAGSKLFQCRSNTVNITGSNNYAAYYNAGTPNAAFECNTATGAAGVMGYKIDMSPQTSLICNMTQGAVSYGECRGRNSLSRSCECLSQSCK